MSWRSWIWYRSQFFLIFCLKPVLFPFLSCCNRCSTIFHGVCLPSLSRLVKNFDLRVMGLLLKLQVLRRMHCVFSTTSHVAFPAPRGFTRRRNYLIGRLRALCTWLRL